MLWPPAFQLLPTKQALKRQCGWFLVYTLDCYGSCSVTKSHPTLCDHMDYGMPGFPVPQYLPESAQVCVH